MNLEIERKVQIRCNGNIWWPLVVKLGAPDAPIECIKFAPYDVQLVKLVASISGIELTSEEKKKHSTIADLPGFIKLRDYRNRAQELSETKKAGRSLFAAAAADAAPKRINLLTKDKTAGDPELFDFEIDGVTLSMQRPSKHNDVLVAKLDHDNVHSILEFLKTPGLDREILFVGKRKYKSSGQKGVHCFGKYKYESTDTGLKRHKSLEDYEDSDSSSEILTARPDDVSAVVQDEP